MYSICGLVEVLSPEIKKDWVFKPQSAAFAEGRKSNTLFKLANLRICNLRNLFADRPLVIT